MTRFLAPSAIERSVLEAGLDDQHRHALLATAARISADPKLSEDVDRLHRVIYHKQPGRDRLREDIEAAFPGDAAQVWGVIALDSVRLVRERAEARRIPPWSYSLLHWRHALYLLNEHRRKIGVAGAVRHDYLSWFSIVASGELCRVGILEFAITISRFAVVAYRHRGSGATIALSCDGQKYDTQGFQVGELTWEATLAEDGAGATGYPIDPGGHTMRTAIHLPATDWQRVFGPGDCVIEMHIPEGSTLHEDQLRQSLIEAERWFPKYFGDYPPHRAYLCESWLFSSLLPQFTPERSRIVQWQRQHYLFPTGNSADGEHAFKSFVFADNAIDFATAPRTTRMQRAVIDYALGGGMLRTGCALFLPQDIASFGSEPYLTTSRAAISAALEQAQR
jgi:hypothetical protein